MLTKSGAHDLLSLIAVLRRTRLGGTNADLETSLWLYALCPITTFFYQSVHSHFPPNWTIYSDFPLLTSNY